MPLRDRLVLIIRKLSSARTDVYIIRKRIERKSGYQGGGEFFTDKNDGKMIEICKNHLTPNVHLYITDTVQAEKQRIQSLISFSAKKMDPKLLIQ